MAWWDARNTEIVTGKLIIIFIVPFYNTLKSLELRSLPSILHASLIQLVGF
jgi:hypothetical protein